MNVTGLISIRVRGYHSEALNEGSILAMYVRAYVLPSALVRGFEWGIYSRNVRTYVSVTLRNVNLRSHASRALTRSRGYRMR